MHGAEQEKGKHIPESAWHWQDARVGAQIKVEAQVPLIRLFVLVLFCQISLISRRVFVTVF